MKRVAVIAIFMAVMASLFAFPVFGETPVQPLQVITYSDTTTNVRISGTAERLHYNVDSFQVVFMNPPNNYGTACTPVLVSFRFYNSSDLPAYVGQAEFELTATNSTGAVNTIIYGYDQISTDLFVAESSYSTAEVGRIGIGASNDFAYYTGFVIPPRTSLYFSCIVYVNASAYAQNNTGATEDVNQVTLSSLNLYSNQISFSADYPYHNQPIDFSNIIDAIGDLSDNVSTSSEMQQIISLLTYTGSSYIDNGGSGVNTTVSYEVPNKNITSQLVRVIYPYVIENVDFEIDDSNDSLLSYQYYKYHVLLFIRQDNNNDLPLNARTNTTINNIIPNLNTYHASISNIVTKSNLYDIAYVYYNGSLVLHNEHITDNLTTSLIPVGMNVTMIEFDIYSPVKINSWPSYELTDFVPSWTSTVNTYEPKNIFQLLKDWFNSYKSVSGLDDIDDTSDEITDKSENAHTQEQSYFTQNAQAIQQTGLNNYRFNGDQENGIGSVSHDFTLLWNALGGFNSIYIFSLTLSLALMILRHAPGAIKSSWRDKEE